MKAKSLSVFRTKLRNTDAGTVLVTIGQVIEGDDDHLRALARNRLVELLEDGDGAAAKAATKGKSAPKPGAAAKAATKGKSAPKPGAAAKAAKGQGVEGKTESAPLAGTGEGEQMPPTDGSEALPPVQTAPEGGEGKE